MMERSEQLRREPTQHAAPRTATEGAEVAELLPSARSSLRLGSESGAGTHSQRSSITERSEQLRREPTNSRGPSMGDRRSRNDGAKRAAP